MKALFLCLLFVGCASGINVSKEDEARCKAQGCAVHTQSDLIEWAKRFFNLGYKAGVKSI